MNMNPSCSGNGRYARKAGLSLIALLLGACGPIEPGRISPLSGTWTGISAGGAYYGTIVFDYFGHMDSLETVALNGNQLHYIFDGLPHYDTDDNPYVATASTALTDSQFEVKARVEYSEGKHEGITRITVKGIVDFGSLEGTIRVAFPDIDPFTQDLKAVKT